MLEKHRCKLHIYEWGGVYNPSIIPLCGHEGGELYVKLNHLPAERHMCIKININGLYLRVEE